MGSFEEYKMIKPVPEEKQQIENDKKLSLSGTENNIDQDESPLSKEDELEKEPEYRSIEYYLQKSKIADKREALKKLMIFAGVNSEEELKNKLQEKDENGDNEIEIDIFTPEVLNYERYPSLRLLKKIRNVGDALGYTFANTPGYESQVDDMISRMKSKGEKEKAFEAGKIFEEDKRIAEREREKSAFKEIDLALLQMEKDEQMQFIENQKNLPPDGIVYLYHGLNGSYRKVQAVLDSPSHGIEQHSGPSFSFIPVGQFWKKGDLGFRYALRRDQIEFPGEENPNAVIKIEDDVGVICNETGKLPLDQFEAEVMRSVGTYPDFDAEKKIKEKLIEFSKLREARRKLKEYE